MFVKNYTVFEMKPFVDSKIPVPLEALLAELAPELLETNQLWRIRGQTHKGRNYTQRRRCHILSCDKVYCESGHVIFVTLMPNACKYDARPRNCGTGLFGLAVSVWSIRSSRFGLSHFGQAVSVWPIRSGRFGLSRFGLSRFGLSRFGLSCFGLSRFGLSRFGLSCFGLADSVWLFRSGDISVRLWILQ